MPTLGRQWTGEGGCPSWGSVDGVEGTPTLSLSGQGRGTPRVTVGRPSSLCKDTHEGPRGTVQPNTAA